MEKWSSARAEKYFKKLFFGIVIVLELVSVWYHDQIVIPHYLSMDKNVPTGQFFLWQKFG